MKNISTLLLVTLAFFSIESKAQIGHRDRLVLGLKVGINRSNEFSSQDDQFSSSAKTGFVGGVFLAVPLGKVIGLQPELLFSQKGFKGTGYLLATPFTFKRTANFADIPLFVTVKPADFITILAGPQFSYLLHQSDDFTSTIPPGLEGGFNNDNIRKSIFGFATGVDINITRVVVGMRVAWDVMDNRGDGNYATPQYKNFWFQGTIGYRFY